MKKIFLIAFTFLLVTSCGLDEIDSYGESFGVVKTMGNGKLCIKDDDGTILVSVESISSFVGEGDRVWTSYSIDGDIYENDTLVIKPYRVTKIKTVDLYETTDVVDAGIDLWSAWIAQDFLTFDFRVWAKDNESIKDHEYVLELQRWEQDTMFINFKHDSKGDDEGGLFRTSIALDLRDTIHTVGENLLTIAINYQNFEGTKYTIYRTLKNEGY